VALPYREIWMVDFEYIHHPGERPQPICLVAWDKRSGRRLRLWYDQFGPTPPYSVDADSLFVAYYASAELGCHRALGWPMPARILDPFVEFRERNNKIPSKRGGKTPKPSEASLLAAMAHFGLDSIGVVEKEAMRALVLRGSPWSRDEKADILDYCQSDVEALDRLLPAMLPKIDLPRALLRGRYMAAVAAMEHNGVPIDIEMLERLRHGWPEIQDRLIAEVDVDYGVYDGRRFKADRFAQWLAINGIPWPRLSCDRLALDDETFRQQAITYPAISPLRELRKTLSSLRLNNLAVGQDARNRTMLSAFRSRTGRNQPSNSRFIFGTSAWLRSLIKPPQGHATVYLDWKQQEFGIAAALSGDSAMREAYSTGDPYLAFAKQAGAVPTDATGGTHKAKRELFKACALGVLFGMEASALAKRIGRPLMVARELLHSHHQTYPIFWSWSDAIVDAAILEGSLKTVFGWHARVDQSSNPRAVRNFPMQANGAEMLRIACCLATERGIEVCAPIHDAILICAPLERLESDIAATRAAMAEASRAVLDGFELGTDVAVTRWPDRYVDKREADRGDKGMWVRVVKLLEQLDPEWRQSA
jgi:hypothetical protein